jgi:hypothetical protein
VCLFRWKGINRNGNRKRVSFALLPNHDYVPMLVHFEHPERDFVLTGSVFTLERVIPLTGPANRWGKINIVIHSPMVVFTTPKGSLFGANTFNLHSNTSTHFCVLVGLSQVQLKKRQSLLAPDR